MGSKKLWVSQMVLHRKTRITWNGEQSLFNKLPSLLVLIVLVEEQSKFCT
jgi:hypothetical protein